MLNVFHCTPRFNSLFRLLRQSHYDYAKEPFWLGWQRLQLPREITETALAHVIGDEAEQAYRRATH
jgi:hypothetical protein